ncbi:MAG: zeta toxin family protein [Betaproteobacteria bacterium]|nr:zeta toxin family protein [Betaproteobacteria bacterium]
MPPSRPSRIYVIAGVNGAGKSSIGGAAFRSLGGDYFNPDETARELMAATSGLGQTEADIAAWQQGSKLLSQAIAERLDYAFETTLGGNTIPRLLAEAAAQGIAIYVWYAGLSSPELHIQRVRSRVRKGGHDIPEEAIRRRYERSRLNLIALLPGISALRIYDNSVEGDPADGNTPVPALVLHTEHGKILNPNDLALAPEWAKPIVAAAMKLGLERRKR